MRTENEISGESAEERGIPGTSTRKKSRVRTLVVVGVVIALMCVGSGFAIVAINRFTQTKLAEKAAARKLDADRQHSASSDTKDLSGIQSQIRHDEAASAAQAALAAAAQPASDLATPAGAMTPRERATQTSDARHEDRAAAPPMSELDTRLYDSSLSVLPASDTKVAGLAGGASDGLKETMDALKAATKGTGNDNGMLPHAETGKGNAFENSLQASNIADGKASFLPDLDYLLQRGTLIRCGTITKIDTTTPGAVKCILLENVYSANGHTVLLRAGAQAFGEQRQALMQGQARIAVLWDEIDDGKVRVDVNSPAADSLGAGGIAATVDNHFWERFGGAAMVSLIGTFGQALANTTIGGSGTNINLSTLGSGSTEVAGSVLQNTINIPPTAVTNQGEITNIFVARHIDMSSVYRVVNDE
jgi:type IV secretion system protein VirB10